MATRYCGKVKINCKLVHAPGRPHGEQYKCDISLDGKRLGTQYVGIPPFIDKAIDSPESYDEAAHAALSFAQHEEDSGEKDWGSFDAVCDYSDTGWFIRRGLKYSVQDEKEIERINKEMR